MVTLTLSPEALARLDAIAAERGQTRSDLLPSAAEALDALGLGDVGCVNTPERMAWLVAVLRHVPDSDAAFPHGKWATIQRIESQVAECAKDRAATLKNGA